MTSLFRREALEARRSGQLGSVLVQHGVTLRLLTALTVVVGLALLLFLGSSSYTRRTRVPGQLAPASGVATAYAPTSGVVAQLHVTEGANVTTGTLLAVIRVPSARAGGGDTVEELRANLLRRRNELERGRASASEQCELRRVGLSAQFRQALAELAAIDSELATRRAQLRLSDETLEQWRALQQQHFVSALQWRQQQGTALTQRADLQSLQRQAMGIRRVLAQIRLSLAELPAQQLASIEGFDRELALLERERIELESAHESAIVAQVPGAVASILVKAGESVQAGQQLLSVLPADSLLLAELLVPSRAVGFVRPGDAVHLRYQAFPYQKFGHQLGHVRQVGRSALDPAQARTLLRGLAFNEPFYRVTVELTKQFVVAYGQAQPLMPGMQLDADIMGDRRRLLEWLFEPLYALRSTMSGR